MSPLRALSAFALNISASLHPLRLSPLCCIITVENRPSMVNTYDHIR